LGAAAVVFEKTSGLLAQQQFEGVKRTLFKEFRSMIPGVAKIVLREVRYQPGAKTSRTMPHTMVCECTVGVLEVTQDTMTTTINTGEMWTCHKGMPETVENKGTTPAVMRVIELVPA
jgi:quercetin dioxygenase-like cupin family protein